MSDANTELPPGDAATATVFVDVPPEVAFEVFTREIDRWWQRGPRYRFSGKNRGLLYFEPHVGGRLFESWEDESGSRVHEVGKVTIWDEPKRLEFEWRNANFAPADKTTVDVRFEPLRGGTKVVVQHRGWSTIAKDHPARHGMDTRAFLRSTGMWWGDLMTALREHVDTTRRGIE